MIADFGGWVTNGQGNPSRWVALVLAVLFGVAAVAVALFGQGPHVTTVLGGLFIIAFNTAFGRRPLVAQVVAELARLARSKK